MSLDCYIHTSYQSYLYVGWVLHSHSVRHNKEREERSKQKRKEVYRLVGKHNIEAEKLTLVLFSENNWVKNPIYIKSSLNYIFSLNNLWVSFRTQSMKLELRYVREEQSKWEMRIIVGVVYIMMMV